MNQKYNDLILLLMILDETINEAPFEGAIEKQLSEGIFALLQKEEPFTALDFLEVAKMGELCALSSHEKINRLSPEIKKIAKHFNSRTNFRKSLDKKFPFLNSFSFKNSLISLLILFSIVSSGFRFYRIIVCDFMSDQNLCIGSKIEECKIENKQESCLQASSIAEREMSNDSLARVFLMHGCDLNSGRACDLLATRINRQTGDTAQAMAIAKKACDLGMEIGCLNAACYASLLQKNEEALDFLKQSVNLGYNNWSWIHKDDDLIGLRATAGFIEFDQKFNPSFTSK